VNKLKKAIKTFRTYLGRDAEAIRHLDTVTALANEIRKSSAAKEKEVATLRSRIETLQKESTNAHQEATKAKQAMEAEAARRRGAEIREKQNAVRIAKLQQAMEPEPEWQIECRPELMDAASYKRLVRCVRGSFSKGPPPLRSTSGKCYSVLLEHALKDFSHSECASLGMLVALLAVSNMPVVVKSQTTIKDRPNNWSTAAIDKLVLWLKKSWVGESVTGAKIRGPSKCYIYKRTQFGNTPAFGGNDEEWLAGDATATLVNPTRPEPKS